jgi:hypothetical protein
MNMAMFLRQDEQRSEVQKRVAAELQERLRNAPPAEPADLEPVSLENQHPTSRAGMVIMVLLFMLAIAIVVFAVRIS